MRVALVCPYAWNRYGGVQTHVRALGRALARRGHDVAVIAPQSARAELAVDDPAVRTIIVGRAVPVPANGSVAPLAFGPGAGASTRRALRSYAPDLVHLHEPLIPSVSLFALLNTDVPAVGTFHAAARRSWGYGASRQLLERAVRRLTVRTAVSESARDLIARYFPGRYLLTPNGVDVGRFSSAPPLEWAGRRTIVFVGRLEPRKGLDTLIQATALLGDLGVGLAVAGAGPESAPARRLARRLGVRVRWLGSVSDADLPRVYRSGGVYCAPNLVGESFGMVLTEAMAAGVPVVCSDLPSFRAVTGGAARLVSPGDAGALAAALRRVLTDEVEARRMSKRSREIAVAFDWDRLTGAMERIYDSCLESRRSAPSA